MSKISELNIDEQLSSLKLFCKLDEIDTFKARYLESPKEIHARGKELLIYAAEYQRFSAVLFLIAECRVSFMNEDSKIFPELLLPSTQRPARCLFGNLFTTIAIDEEYTNIPEYLHAIQHLVIFLTEKDALSHLTKYASSISCLRATEAGVISTLAQLDAILEPPSTRVPRV